MCIFLEQGKILFVKSSFCRMKHVVLGTEKIFIELMPSDRQLHPSREGSK